MTLPRVSVVIDNYNYGRFLGEAIDSVLAQDLPRERYEIVVVDDGSTDDTREVLARYAADVRAVFQENQGCAAALTRGFAEAKGEIVSILDADDVFAPTKLRRVLDRFDREPDLTAVEHFLHDADGELRPRPVRYPDWPERYTLDDYVEGKMALGVASGLSFRKKAIEDALPIPKVFRFLYQDDYLTVRSVFRGPVGNIAEPLGSHRGHGSNNFAGGPYADGRKLDAFLAAHKVFSECRERWLKETGRALSPRFQRAEGLEVMRKAILAQMYAHNRGEAARTWARGMRDFGTDPFGLFRVATCGVALVSPRAYLWLHDRYSAWGGALALRERFLPT